MDLSITYVSELHKSGVGQTLSDIRASKVTRLANTVSQAIRSNDSDKAHSTKTPNADELTKFSEMKDKEIIS